MYREVRLVVAFLIFLVLLHVGCLRKLGQRVGDALTSWIGDRDLMTFGLFASGKIWNTAWGRTLAARKDGDVAWAIVLERIGEQGSRNRIAEVWLSSRDTLKGWGNVGDEGVVAWALEGRDGVNVYAATSPDWTERVVYAGASGMTYPPVTMGSEIVLADDQEVWAVSTRTLERRRVYKSPVQIYSVSMAGGNGMLCWFDFLDNRDVLFGSYRASRVREIRIDYGAGGEKNGAIGWDVGVLGDGVVAVLVRDLWPAEMGTEECQEEAPKRCFDYFTSRLRGEGIVVVSRGPKRWETVARFSFEGPLGSVQVDGYGDFICWSEGASGVKIVALEDRESWRIWPNEVRALSLGSACLAIEDDEGVKVLEVRSGHVVKTIPGAAMPSLKGEWLAYLLPVEKAGKLEDL